MTIKKDLRLYILVSLILFLILTSCSVQEQKKEIRKADQSYSKEEIDYFFEIAFGIEFGDSKTIKKWVNNIRYKVKGSPTEEDMQTLKAVIEELETITKKKVTFKKTNIKTNMTIWFVPVDDMHRYEPNYISGNWGYFYIWWNERSEIYRTRVLIGTDQPNQKERNHLIREEITQSLGLGMDSWTYEESIFYQEWTSVQEYTDLDKKLIEILYREDIKPGMTKTQVERILIDGSDSR